MGIDNYSYTTFTSISSDWTGVCLELIPKLKLKPKIFVIAKKYE